MPGNRNCFESNDATEAAPGLATAADGHNLFCALSFHRRETAR
jgi:hypothetical protein